MAYYCQNCGGYLGYGSTPMTKCDDCKSIITIKGIGIVAVILYVLIICEYLYWG